MTDNQSPYFVVQAGRPLEDCIGFADREAAYAHANEKCSLTGLTFIVYRLDAFVRAEARPTMVLPYCETKITDTTVEITTS